MRFLLVVLVFASAAYGLSEICSLKLDQGKCRASHKRYGFDKKEGKCVEFVFGGCGGNKNNFETKEACEKECMMKNAGKKSHKKLASGSNSGQKLKKILLKEEEEQKKVESLKKLASGSNSGQKLDKLKKILLKEEEQKKVGATVKKAIIKEKLKDSLPKPLIMNDQINLIVPKRNLSMAISGQKKLNLGKPQILPLHGMPQKEEQKKVGAAVKKAIIKETLKDSLEKPLIMNDQINLIVPKRNPSMAISEQKKLNLGKPQILPLHGMPQKEEQKKVGAAVKKAIMKEEIKQSVKNAVMENKLKQPVLVAN
ncbi:hypothetical protein RB195_017568 [Necator americanus]